MGTFQNCNTQEGMCSLTHHSQNQRKENVLHVSAVAINILEDESSWILLLVADTNLVGFGEEAGGQHRVFWGLQAVGGALWHDNVHGYVTHCVEFLYRKTQMSGKQDDTQDCRALRVVRTAHVNLQMQCVPHWSWDRWETGHLSSAWYFPPFSLWRHGCYSHSWPW